MSQRKHRAMLATVLDDHEILDLEEKVERTKEQKIEDWNKLIGDYREELEILDGRRADLEWFIERLRGMLERVG